MKNTLCFGKYPTNVSLTQEQREGGMGNKVIILQRPNVANEASRTNKNSRENAWVQVGSFFQTPLEIFFPLVIRDLLHINCPYITHFMPRSIKPPYRRKKPLNLSKVFNQVDLFLQNGVKIVSEGAGRKWHTLFRQTLK